MEDIVFFLLALIPYSSSESPPFTASACYGVDTCDFVYLECRNKTFIHILSAQYIFTNTECSNPQLCNRRNGLGCCEPMYEYKRGIDLSEEAKGSLNKTCSSEPSCKYRAPWTTENSITSSLVQVNFTCKHRREDTYEPEDRTTPDPRPESLQDSDNTAAIVVPIVVLLAIVLAALVFLYWKRKKHEQNEKPIKSENCLPQRAVQNDAYLKTITSNAPNTEQPENTYHTIDLNSLPDDTDGHQAPGDPGPQDVYHMIDPNKMDYEMPANHDYFILEPEAGGTTKAHGVDLETEYNKVKLESNEVVKDPNYHRLGNLGDHFEDKHGDVDDSYSHLETAHNTDNAKMVNEVVKQQEDILNDDYSHLK